MMSPEAFRRDRYLRAAGYNFYVWAIVNVLVTLPAFAALAGRPWPGWLGGLFPIVLIFAGFFVCALNDNRVAKMCGADGEPAIDAARLWLPVFLFGWLMTTLFVVRGPVAYIQPLWLLLVGMAYMIWGNFSVSEFRWLGWVLILSGAYAGLAIRPFDLPPGTASLQALVIWTVVMGLLWVPFGAYINRKYLYSAFRDGAAAAPLEASRVGAP